MMDQIPVFSSISELVKFHEGDISRRVMGKTTTGKKVIMEGVSIQKDNGGGITHFLTDGENRMYCFGKDIRPYEKADVTGTYHGDFFRVYEINNNE